MKLGLIADFRTRLFETADDLLAFQSEKIGIGAQKTADIGIARQIGQAAGFDRFEIDQTDSQIAGDGIEFMAQVFAHLAHHRAQLGGVETFRFRWILRFHSKMRPSRIAFPSRADSKFCPGKTLPRTSKATLTDYPQDRLASPRPEK